VEPAAAPVRQRTSGYAVASLVFGVLGFLVLPIVLSILAIVFSRSAEGEIRRDPAVGGEGLARAGFVLGVIGLVIQVVGLLLVLLLWA
jgi:Domain of unknown function (DUF4190)